MSDPHFPPGNHLSSLKLFALDILRPKPSPFKLIKLGGEGDGAYLLPDDLEGIEACFSPGTNNLKSFEDDLAMHYGIQSHMCDYTSDVESFATPLIIGLQTFERRFIEPVPTPLSMTLEQWIHM